MKFCKFFCMAAALPLGVMAAELPAPATEVQIFRNGTALIRHQVTPGNASVFTVSGNFSPLEGSLWSSPNVKQIRKTLTEVTRKEHLPLNNITETYKNQAVTLYINSGLGKVEAVKGTVLDLCKKEQHSCTNFVTLKCTRGGIKFITIPRDQVVRVESDALKIAEATVKEEKQAWEFTMVPKAAGKVTFDYITKILDWTPAFRMTLLPEKKFTLTGSATVVNQGDELKNVKCILWAGAPNIENSSVFSPMAIVKKAIPRPPQPRPYMLYKARERAVPMAARAVDDASFGSNEAAEPGITENMAPFNTGTLSLKKNEALVRSLGSAAGSYENLVRWRIPPRENDNGRNVWRQRTSEVSEDLWECLRFVNPFKHPIPDAAVEICDGTALIAQIKGSWVNTGESATWEITRCRDVKATFVEQEAPSSVKDRGVKLFQRIERGKSGKSARSVSVVSKNPSGPVSAGFYNGSWYRITDIKGRIQLKNFRKAPVKLTIEMDYFGEFVSASHTPEKKLLNHFGSLNPKNQLVWNLTLKPGETRKLDFRYNIIINR